jgi:hypothetical protein
VKRKNLTNVVALYFNLNNPALPHYLLYARTDSGLNVGENRERNKRRENSDRRNQGRRHGPDRIRNPSLPVGSCRAGTGGRQWQGSDWIRDTRLSTGGPPVSEARKRLEFVGRPAGNSRRPLDVCLFSQALGSDAL